MNKIIDKLKNFFSKKIKLIIFLIVFIVICSIFNTNSQTLNFILKRGVILEYSYNNKFKVNEIDLEKKLISLGIKYYFLEEQDRSIEKYYDFENKLVEKTLFIGIPYKATKDKVELINNISNYMFENYKNSKLIQLRTMSEYYSKPYSAFALFSKVLVIATLVWILILSSIFGFKKTFIDFYEAIKNCFVKQKMAFVKLISETKQKGIGYLIKRILFEDDIDSDNNSSMTKEIINTIIIVLVCVAFIRYFIGELRWIPSGSMRLTILEKDRVYVEKLEFPKREIKRGDILVFYPPEEEISNSPIAIFKRLTGIFCKDVAFIKRAIGMPNDKFEIKFNNVSQEYRVFINDIPLNEPYINSKQDWTPCKENMHCGPFIIPEGNYFMMGDNRGNSQDSRFWGFLPKERIIGRANFMFFPIRRINLLNDKYLKLHKERKNGNFVDYDYILNRYEFLYRI